MDLQGNRLITFAHLTSALTRLSVVNAKSPIAPACWLTLHRWETQCTAVVYMLFSFSCDCSVDTSQLSQALIFFYPYLPISIIAPIFFAHIFLFRCSWHFISSANFPIITKLSRSHFTGRQQIKMAVFFFSNVSMIFFIVSLHNFYLNVLFFFKQKGGISLFYSLFPSWNITDNLSHLLVYTS